jgi:hypothetical protein
VPSPGTLRDDKVAGVLQQLLTEYDDHPEPAVTDEEIAERSREDEDFVRALAAELGLEEPGSEPTSRDLLTSLAALPEISEKAERAAEDVRSRATLPFGQQLLSTLISVAAAVAILRPKIEYRKTGKEVKFAANVHGVPDPASIIQIVLDLMRKSGQAPKSLPAACRWNWCASLATATGRGRLGTQWEPLALADASWAGTCSRVAALTSANETVARWWSSWCIPWVKGSRVQIPPSRLFFEQLYPELGTEIRQLGTIMQLCPLSADCWLRSAARWEGQAPGRPRA